MTFALKKKKKKNNWGLFWVGLVWWEVVGRCGWHRATVAPGSDVARGGAGGVCRTPSFSATGPGLLLCLLPTMSHLQPHHSHWSGRWPAGPHPPTIQPHPKHPPRLQLQPPAFWNPPVSYLWRYPGTAPRVGTIFNFQQELPPANFQPPTQFKLTNIPNLTFQLQTWNMKRENICLQKNLKTHDYNQPIISRILTILIHCLRNLSSPSRSLGRSPRVGGFQKGSKVL